MIKAAVRISASMQHTMTQDMLKDYVLSSLQKHIAGEVAKQMTISKIYNPMTDDTTYTGTLTLPLMHTTSNNLTVSGATASGFNGTVAVRNTSVQEILRVVEYTKNGKVTRVELQKYDEESDDWMKIPRIQIEE